jgi:hypothetical protein
MHKESLLKEREPGFKYGFSRFETQVSKGLSHISGQLSHHLNISNVEVYRFASANHATESEQQPCHISVDK